MPGASRAARAARGSSPQRSPGRTAAIAIAIAHLVYLLGVTGDQGGGPEDSELEDALGGVGAGDWFEGALSVVSGVNPPPAGTTFANAVDALIAQLEHWGSVTPENWKSLLFRGQSGD